MERYFSPIARVFLLISLASGASAASIQWEDLNFSLPSFAISGVDDVSISGTSSGYSFSAEFCESTHCSSPVDSTFDSLLKFSNATITCNQFGGCPQLIFQFAAEIGMFPSPTSGFAGVDLSLDGTTNTGTVTGSAAVCYATGSFLCSSDGTGSQSFSTSFIIGTSGPFGAPGESGTAFIQDGFSVFGQMIIDSMANGQSLQIPGSLDLTTNLFLGGGQVPEPAAFTLGVLGISLLAIPAIRKRRRSR